MSKEQVITLLFISIQLMTPILWTSLGEVFSEQGGILNIGAEGNMLFGAWAAATVVSYTGSVWLGVAGAVGAGVFAGCFLGWLFVRRGVDQIVAGIVYTLLALGLTAALYERFVGDEPLTTMSPWRVPLLSDIPWLGEIVFRQTPLVYLAIVCVPISYVALRRTWWGLYLRGAGEDPHAVESGGLSVRALRFSGEVVASVLHAVGGAALVLITSGNFVPGMTAGRGFIALGVVVLAAWNPIAVLAACALFGLAQAMPFQASTIVALDKVPTDVWLSLPYIFAILAVLVARGSRYPSAVNVAWRAVG